MKKVLPVALLVIVAIGAALWFAAPAQPALDEQIAMLDQYCVDCHNDAEFTGNVSFEQMHADDPRLDAALWERALRKLRAGAMPPREESNQPEAERVAWLIGSVEQTLDALFTDNPTPPAPLIHRLNRTEYSNAIRDLLGVEIDASTHLPPDSVVDGFDNVAEALTVSPALLEGYLAASADVVSLAVGDEDMGAAAKTYRARPDHSQNAHVPGAPLGTTGGIVAEHYFPVDGTYRIQPRLYRQILASIRGLEFPRALEISIDRERIHYAEFGGPEDQKYSNEVNAFEMAEEIDARLTAEAQVPAGMHTVAVAFVGQAPILTPDVWQEFERELFDSNEDKGLPHLDQLDIVGPLQVSGVGDTPSRQKIFTCYPQAEQDEPFCATEILNRLAQQAYRRPVTEEESADLISYYEGGREAGDFEDGVKMALRRMISGPEFIFRAERDPDNVTPGSAYAVDDIELASRLSFFLWSSIPDQELLDAAIARELSTSDVFDAQVARMLRDPKSRAFVRNFAGQWLTLRNLDAIIPDPEVYPDFDNNLRQAFTTETELFFESIVREDRNVLDLLDADYTFVNARLARHYGIPDVYGERFRRVEVSDPARRGILGHGSIHTLTSVATRTSPVTRGKWVLANLLGMPPPDPPADVPAIEASATGQPQTLREQMTRHRTDPVCASCHQIMDPFGFVLESFDAVGRWRVEDGGKPIDTRDLMFDGTEVADVEGLRAFLLDKQDLFLQTLTERLMTYALGRSVEPSDMPVVRQILREAAANDYRFSSIILGIANSASFRMRTAGPAEDGETMAMTAPAAARR